MSRILLFVLFVLISRNSISQSSVSEYPVLDKTHWNVLKTDEELLYSKKIKGRKKGEKEDSGEDKSKQQKKKTESDPIVINLGAKGQVIIIGLFIALILTLLYLLIGKELLLGKNKKIESEWLNTPDTGLEIAEETDLKKRLLEAKAQNNYKLVIRLYFLMIISQMDQERLILWKKEKTNLDYIYELEGSPFHGSFKNLSRWYDIVWYGEKEYSRKNLKSLSEEFGTFQNELKRKFK